MEALPLKEILAGILKEFEAAGVAADVSREHWRQVYESSALLREFAPSRLRVTEATVSLPLALAQITPPKPQTPTLTRMQILRVLPDTLPRELREQLADEGAHFVQKTRRITFANKRLASSVTGFLADRVRKRDVPDFDHEGAWAEVGQKLEQLRQDFQSSVSQNPDREVLFSYQTEELVKLGAEKLTRFDLKIAID